MNRIEKHLYYPVIDVYIPSKKKFRITIAMHLLTPCTKYAKGVIGSYKSKKHSSHFVILIFLTFKLIEKAKYVEEKS